MGTVSGRSSALMLVCAGCAMWQEPVGQQEVHEYEALRGGFRIRLYCRLTSSSQSLQTNLRIILDSTGHSTQTCKRALRELEDAGLILRVRQGIGAPNRIYVLVPKKRD